MQGKIDTAWITGQVKAYYKHGQEFCVSIGDALAGFAFDMKLLKACGPACSGDLAMALDEYKVGDKVTLSVQRGAGDAQASSSGLSVTAD